MANSGDGFDDDDFGEFGGFEAAEPTLPCEAKPLSTDSQAATSWVMAAVASSIPQTDIAMTASGDNPQNVMKSLQNQSAATKTDIAYSHELSLDDCLGGTNWAAMGEDLDDITKEDKNTFQADFSAKEVVSSEKLWAEKALSQQEANTCKQGDDLESPERVSSTSSIGTDQHHTAESDSCQQVSFSSPNLEDDLDLDTVSSQASHTSLVSMSTAKLDSVDKPLSVDSALISDKQTVRRNDDSDDDASMKTLTELHLLRQQQQQIKEELQQELDKLSKHNALLESERRRLEDELDKQEHNYQLLQKRHAKELEEVRQAGHKAIAIIVEEYKELCKLAILEQQEKNKEMLSEAISIHTERQESLLKKQEEQFIKQMEMLNEEHRNSLTETISSLREEHQKELQSVIQEESRKAKESVKKAIQEEQKLQKKNLDEMMEEERKKNLVYLEEQQKKWQDEVAGLKKEMLNLLEKVAEDEHKKSENAIKKALEDEREQHKEEAKIVLCDMKAQMEKYINEQRQTDKKVLQRSLAATDLFLESARRQLQLLLQTDDNPDEPLTCVS